MRHDRINTLLPSPVFLTAALLVCCGCAAMRPTTANNASLPSPQDEAVRAYLGLRSDIERFSQEDVQAEILVIDFFDMYCHICQIQARHMNDFYKLAQDRGLADRLKIIGVGVGDTPLEVKLFKDKCKLPFPVFPDRTAAFARQFGQIKVPSLIVLKKQANHFQIIYHAPGLPAKPEELLSQLLSNSFPQSSRRTEVLDSQSSVPTCDTGAAQCETRPAKTGSKGSVSRRQSSVDSDRKQSDDLTK